MGVGNRVTCSLYEAGRTEKIQEKSPSDKLCLMPRTIGSETGVMNNETKQNNYRKLFGTVRLHTIDTGWGRIISM